MPFWKPKKKKKAVHKAKPAKSLPKYEPKPFIPPEIPKIDISANQQKEPQKPAPKKASSSRADDKDYDWSDLELSLSDIEALIGMAKS